MTLLPLFQWCEQTAIGHAIRNSQWAFPVIEVCHLLAFATIGGALLLVDLRLLGLVMNRQHVGELAREAHPWLIGSLLVMVITGIMMFLSESVKCYYSNPFWIKMSSLFLAIVFTFTVRRKVTTGDGPPGGPAWGKVTGAVSIVLWATVAWGGRWIGFSG